MITRTNASCYLIAPDIPGLDNIQVFFVDFCTGNGQVVLSSYGRAWSAYFNAIGDKTIKQFFLEASAEYLTGKLARMNSNKAETVNLRRLVETAKETIVTAEASDLLADNPFLVDSIYGSGDVIRR